MEDPCAISVDKIFVLYSFRCHARGHSYDEYLQYRVTIMTCLTKWVEFGLRSKLIGLGPTQPVHLNPTQIYTPS